MQIYPVLDYNWGLMAPEITILVTATLLSLWDLLWSSKRDRRILGWVALFGTLVAFVLAVSQVGQPVQEILGDKYRLDAFALAFKLIILAATAFTLVQAISYTDNREISYRGEFFYLFLTAALGGMILVSSADLITIFIGLETLSISTYIMAGMRRRQVASNEAGFKYLVYGGASSATMLYGFSFLYGLTGTTHLYEMQAGLSQAWGQGFGYIISLGFLLSLVGIGFKISTAPFHMWAPDVYQGSPTPLSAFLSVASKAAGYALLFRVFFTLFFDPLGQSSFLPFVAGTVGIIAALSMVWGNTVALRQVNAKRLMAYSSIGQVGYLLIPFATMTNLMYTQVLYFLVAYLLMNMGLFTVIQLVSRQEGNEDISAFAGLYRRAPLLALGTTVLLLSLAGFPFTAGFMGKFLILMSTFATGNYWLPVIMIATTVVSYVFYFGIIRQMYMRQAEGQERLAIPWTLGVVVGIAVLATLVFGALPDLVLSTISQHFPIMEQLFAPTTPGLR